MRVACLMVAAAALLVGCASTISEFAHQNRGNLLKLSIGMSKNQVVEIMGSGSAVTPDGPVSNPFKVEAFQDRGGATYEIYYYVTEPNRRFQPLRIRQATPLVFKDGILAGWGNDFFQRTRMQLR